MPLNHHFRAFRAAKIRLFGDNPDENLQFPFDGRPRLLVGLGNPGRKYRNTRHNVGSRAISLLAKRQGVVLERHGNIDRVTINIAGYEISLASPRTFMNVSGPTIAAELRRLNIRPEALLVVYDDLDLPVGRIRLRQAGGSGGNNGIKSLIEAIGTGDFPRLRIGIDRPYENGKGIRDPDKIATWVLSTPSPQQNRILDQSTTRAVDAIELALQEGFEIAMAHFNSKPDHTTSD
tara:strand:+ start:4093 stop:4794 length:702 start_codon:yes stop_codon:yes gene_type:complete